MKRFCFFLIALMLVIGRLSYAQGLQLSASAPFLSGIKIIKLSRDFGDPFMWVLGENNQLYRFNTITKQKPDEYATEFKNFTQDDIVDIAGINENWVVLATKNPNSGQTKLISYRNGIFTNPTSPPLINSIGIVPKHAYRFSANIGVEFPQVLIAAADALWVYSFTEDKTYKVNDRGSEIYTSIYRAQHFILTPANFFPGLNYWASTSVVLDRYYVVTDPAISGDAINTVFPVLNTSLYSNTRQTPGLQNNTEVVWGANTGLYQLKDDPKSSNVPPPKRYLDGIKINKVVDIYGLLAFGTDMVQENILVGSDNGLYYSTSVARSLPGDETRHDLILQHFDALGNVPVNYIEVNATSQDPPYCEDGVWVATNNGFYLLTPDYSSLLSNAPPLNAVNFLFTSKDVVSTTVCAGTPVTIELDTAVKASVKWFKNGQLIDGANAHTLKVTSEGDYHAQVFDVCSGLNKLTTHLKVEYLAQPAFSFNYPDKLQYCAGTPTNLRVDNTQGYTYRWYTNGTLNGNTTNSYYITKSGKYNVEVSSCGTNWVASKTVDVNIVNLPTPVITTDKPYYSPGGTARLSLNIPVDARYTINWTRNNVPLAVFANINDLAVSEPGVYTASVTYNEPNTDGSICSAVSATVSLTFQMPKIPNMFTPNGDGINDTWQVSGLTGNGDILVNLFNRNGMQIYQSRSYAISWDGQHNGRKLPAGTYYYVVSYKGTAIFSGYVTIVY